ncbi:structural maintenance of chromosomes protein 6A-like [Triticum dicoccoides]|uniref:structural maintenance of chromosomes protein 6A-like n=1 Tax=Triticum dicoccoides TaxID=85692 RepID=UPI00188FE959|nr:structural maintenance of chromosomes protein 6A-like [Triticum dicoccoides]
MTRPHMNAVLGMCFGSFGFDGIKVDCTCGGLLDAFIVSCHKDLQLLRECGCRVLIIPDGSLPTIEHPTVLSIIQSENHTMLNILVDQSDEESENSVYSEFSDRVAMQLEV